ncbi:MAG: hypothetical protein QM651_04760 [Rhodoblastus sp.]
MVQTQHHDNGRPARPYEVRVNGARRGAFRDVREAISSARIKKRETPAAMVGIADASTGQFLFEVDV